MLKSVPAVRETKEIRTNKLDMIGMILSGACLVHCTILPVMLALLPVFGSHFHLDEKWHVVSLLAIVPVAFLALISGWKRHGRNEVLILGAIGVAIMCGVTFMHELLPEASAVIINGMGSACLISAHLRNFLIQRRTGCGCCEHH